MWGKRYNILKYLDLCLIPGWGKLGAFPRDLGKIKKNV